jgi:serine/threonine-protein kinase RsbW
MEIAAVDPRRPPGHRRARRGPRACCRAPTAPGLGLGLPLIATLAETLELGRADDDRTEVRMTFRLDPTERPHEPAQRGDDGRPQRPAARPCPDAGDRHARRRAQCPIDRLDDALLVADTVAAVSPDHTRNGTVIVGLKAQEGLLELTIGALKPKGAEALLRDAELPGVGNVLERVADTIETRAGDENGEELYIRLGFA